MASPRVARNLDEDCSSRILQLATGVHTRDNEAFRLRVASTLKAVQKGTDILPDSNSKVSLDAKT